MGQTLSEPVTLKESSACENEKLKVGSSCMQGWRMNMEDSHTHILSLPGDPDASFFAVFDGHGGEKSAEYAGNNLHKFITDRPEYKEGNIVEALKQGFLEMDSVMECDENLKKEPSGTTAITIIIKDDKLYCANIGDSRAVACIDGEAKALSSDHKPSKRQEYDRIQAAGGWVECDRVNGNLALSRAFGDFVFKRNPDLKPEEQIVTAYPEITVHKITPEWEFIVLACDGIWDVMGNTEVVKKIRDSIRDEMQPEKICEYLMGLCLAPDLGMAGMGCDNMTVIIVVFLHNKPYATLCSKLRQEKELQEKPLEDMMRIMELAVKNLRYEDVMDQQSGKTEKPETPDQ